VPVRSLPRDPNLAQLRNLAKTPQRLFCKGEPGAVDLVREFHPRFADVAVGSPELTRFTRADMRLTLAPSSTSSDPSSTSAPTPPSLTPTTTARRSAGPDTTNDTTVAEYLAKVT
jgi:hypothetical protein